ncbi:sperm acrosomal protein fsa-acr.1 [Plakobranchus ocellatus]|uniref:Sperm acrosomal protein fsa-acr.1 n=1 Tax=Plakobranchus ocellatus TaxID=259542 RepID=A0AAV3ZJ76_9GAST|nr:sperm acrosomal protein fsa-acr.1 [Plakobranchus ocellatus]
MRTDKTNLYSKEASFDGNHLFWGPGPVYGTSTHLQYWEAAPSRSRLIMYLKDVLIEQNGPQYGSIQLQALRFTGQQSSYATMLYDGVSLGEDNDVQADQNFTWYMEVLPDSSSSGQGVLLEYSDCYSPLRIEQVDMVHIRVTVGDNGGKIHTLQANNILSTINWSRIAVTYKVDEVYLKIIRFPNSAEEEETLLPICSVDPSRRLNATGNVRIGSSYSTDYSAFSGRLGCVQFFQGYMLKNYDLVTEYCDPALSSDEDLNFVEYTKDEDPSNLIVARQCPQDQLTTEGPTTELPTTEEPTTEIPTEKLTTEMLTTEEPTTEIPTTEGSTIEVLTTREPTTEMRTTEESTIEVLSTEEPTTEIPTTEKLTTEMPTTEYPTTEISTTQEPTTEIPTSKEATTEIPTTKEATTEIPTTKEAMTEIPTTEKPTTEISTTEEPTTELPTSEEQTTKEIITAGTVPTAAPLELIDTKERCALFQRALSQVGLDPALPLLSTELASKLGWCAHICFTTPPCSVIGFDGTSCRLTTAGNFTAASFLTTGTYDFFTMG